MRYFYTNPLKALWMLQEFQMQFFCVIFEVGCPAPLKENELREMIYQSLNARLYVESDCHEMLKPQFGDKGIYVSSYFEFTGFYNGWRWQNEECMEIECQDVEITRRNGKAFFAPEVEGD